MRTHADQHVVTHQLLSDCGILIKAPAHIEEPSSLPKQHTVVNAQHSPRGRWKCLSSKGVARLVAGNYLVDNRSLSISSTSDPS